MVFYIMDAPLCVPSHWHKEHVAQDSVEGYSRIIGDSVQDLLVQCKGEPLLHNPSFPPLPIALLLLYSRRIKGVKCEEDLDVLFCAVAEARASLKRRCVLCRS